ncbi:hypothetical protein ASPCAL11632 [Aspergillus calidoustus]|uniref:Uncharacterized protein n=1 Tax=Aspergillus calidoustus TaxID=454130 RepID=A0A0U5G8B9_ASPCI|nr:hypothetical protein ASPCAL11632 [Aspergillus calidoustus]
MTDFVRSSFAGQFLRLATGKKILKYPEERDGFHPPTCYADPTAPEALFKRDAVSGAMMKAENAAEGEGPSRRPSSQDRGSTRSAELLERQNTLPMEESGALAKITTRHELQGVRTQEDLERLYTAALYSGFTQSGTGEGSFPANRTYGDIGWNNFGGLVV